MLRSQHVIVAMALAACSAACRSMAVQGTGIIVEHEATLRYVDGKQVSLKAKVPFQWDGSRAAFLEAPDRVPMLLVRAAPRGGDVRISLKPRDPAELEPSKGAAASALKLAEKAKTALVNGALIGFYEIQKLVLQRRTDDAMVKMGALRALLPGVAFLDVLEANILVARGQPAQAIELLERATKASPDEVEIKLLLEALRAESKTGGT